MRGPLDVPAGGVEGAGFSLVPHIVSGFNLKVVNPSPTTLIKKKKRVCVSDECSFGVSGV